MSNAFHCLENVRAKEPFKYIQQKWNHTTYALCFAFLHIAYCECYPVNKYILYHFKTLYNMT